MTSRQEQGAYDTINIDANSMCFPFEKIRDRFKSDATKSLNFDEDFIQRLLKTQIEDPDCFAILSLLYPRLDFVNQDFHKDHLHYADYFRKLSNHPDNCQMKDYDFYKNPENWNSILNLQLLNNVLNSSKGDKPLDVWIKDVTVDLDTQIIPREVDLSIQNFRVFIEARRVLLANRLRELLR